MEVDASDGDGGEEERKASSKQSDSDAPEKEAEKVERRSRKKRNVGDDAAAPLPVASPQFVSTPFPRAMPRSRPSKADLALQGIDKAVVDAEVVDSDVLVPISDDGSAGTGLSQRLRKRLKELGINELFSGSSAFFSHSVRTEEK